MIRKTSFAVIPALLLVMVMGTAALAAGHHFDFGGETIRLGFRMNDVTPFAPRGDTTWGDPDARLQAHISEVEEMFNVKIEFPQHAGDTNPSPFIEAAISGDILFHYHETGARRTEFVLFPVATDGFIHPLDEYLDEDYYNSLPELFRHTYGMQVAGKTYGVEGTNTFVEPMVLIYNRDIFEEYGLPDPYELYQAGEWTWEAFRQIAIDATMDSTGDGEIDQIGIKFDLNPLGYHVVSWFATNEAAVTRTIDGREVVTFDEVAALEVLEFFQSLWELEVAHIAGGYTNDGTYDRIAMHACFANAFNLPHAGFGPMFTDIHYSMVPFPKGPRADQHYAPLWNRWMGIVPIGVENPRAVIEVVNALRRLTEPYMDVSLADWEQAFWEDWSQYMPDRQSLEVFQYYAPRAVTIDNREVVLAQGLNNTINEIVVNGEDVGSSLAAIKPMVQAFLDETINQ